MKNYLNRITVNPTICNGKPCIRGMRITAKTVLEYLSAGETVENILKSYPDLEKEDITACLEFAVEMMGKDVVETIPLLT